MSTWIGRKKLALVPVFRPNAHPPDQIPDHWEDLIEQRLFNDPDPKTGVDRSLRTYIHTVSSGLADFDAEVQAMETVDAQDVPPDALEGAPGPFGHTLGDWLRSHDGFDVAALVMLGGVGAGTSAGFWCRFVMAEGVGVWAMEFMHSLTGFGDLYPFGGNMGAFDEMACSCGTHPSAFTKRAIQWLDPSAIKPFASDLENEGFVPLLRRSHPAAPGKPPRRRADRFRGSLLHGRGPQKGRSVRRRHSQRRRDRLSDSDN